MKIFSGNSSMRPPKCEDFFQACDAFSGELVMKKVDLSIETWSLYHKNKHARN
jgi:hypothetical protein